MHAPIPVSRQFASSAQTLQYEFSQYESNESFSHAHKHIQCMCEQLTTDSQLSLSPVISTSVHWNDMHVVNHGKYLVACEFN